MLLVKLLEIWQRVFKCTVINGIPDLAATIHQGPVMDSISFDLNSIKIDNTSHKRLFELDSIDFFNNPNPTTDEKMIRVDDMLYCAVLITNVEQVMFTYHTI